MLNTGNVAAEPLPNTGNARSAVEVTLYFPTLRTASLNVMFAQHWATRAKKSHHLSNAVKECASPLMVGGAKPLRDAIARVLHIDDAESENLEWVYKQEKGTGMKVKIEVKNVLSIKGEKGIIGDKGE